MSLKRISKNILSYFFLKNRFSYLGLACCLRIGIRSSETGHQEKRDVGRESLIKRKKKENSGMNRKISQTKRKRP